MSGGYDYKERFLEEQKNDFEQEKELLEYFESGKILRKSIKRHRKVKTSAESDRQAINARPKVEIKRT
ncbi:MAG TPA: hypothetical protein VIL03_05945 [Clostridia bacterium]